MKSRTLDEWLAWQETLHVAAIDLGLERVGDVARRLGLLTPSHYVITVGGTNGKGSTVAMLASILGAAGYRVGYYTSPHLLRYNERIRVAGQDVEDELLCEVFSRVERARGDVSLSFFEFGTLAAMDVFANAELDVAILEVGLGGRLDAVNIQDPDLAIITNIGIDHTDYLGDDRESIGREKAGIMRARRPVVCGDPDAPAAIEAHARKCGAQLYMRGTDFSFDSSSVREWNWQGGANSYEGLPRPAIPGAVQLSNAASVLMGLTLVADRFPVSEAQLHDGLENVALAGRFQRIKDQGEHELLLDVAHNKESAVELARSLQAEPTAGRTLAVFSALRGKDVEGIADSVRDLIDEWHIGEVESGRGLPVAELEQRVSALGARVTRHNTVGDAWRAASQAADPGDRVIVFGSFYTVAEVMVLRTP